MATAVFARGLAMGLPKPELWNLSIQCPCGALPSLFRRSHCTPAVSEPNGVLATTSSTTAENAAPSGIGAAGLRAAVFTTFRSA